MPGVRLSQGVQIALTVALTEAARLGHEYAGTEHLLHALTLDGESAGVLRHAGAKVDRLRDRLASYLEEELPRLQAPANDGGAGGRGGGDDGPGLREPRLSLALERTLARAGAQVDGAGRDEVESSDLLPALFFEQGSHAVALLEDEGVGRLDIVAYLAHGVSKLRPRLPGAGPGGLPGLPGRTADAPGGTPAGDLPPGEMPAGEPEDEPAPEGTEALAAFTQELTAAAARGEIDPLIGRREELSRTLHILQRRRKNNPIFVGDPGVGKTALVEGLALKIAAGEVPERFARARIHRLDMGAILAGTRYRGDFENRLKAVLAALDAEAEAGAAPILFIDEIHTVIGAGSAGRGTLDASNLLKPALSAGRLRCIGATTWEEFRQSFQRDPALARRFQKIEVQEPSVEETVAIFEGLRARYEEHHEVAYTVPAIEAAAELASRHLADRRLPDSALDLLDEAAAAVALKGGKRVSTGEVERVLASMAGIPPQRVKGDERQQLADLEEALKAQVFGQEEAIERLAGAIKVARAGLREPERPVGSFLLTGPTGVGKTEVARQLAAVLGIAFHRFDMSEYMERHSVSRLVGAPPGYVGFDRGGLLTEAVGKSPHAVVLLDEIEKAHPDVFNLLLQVMDHGTLTDTNGKRTDFRHAILLMTSNVGARELAARVPGFGEITGSGGEGREADSARAAERLFSPEFRNRLDARLPFKPLSGEVMLLIVDKQIAELQRQLDDKGVTLELTDAGRRHLAEAGHDPSFGARPLARVIDQRIKRQLTDELLFGRLAKGGTVIVDGIVDAAQAAEGADSAENAGRTESAEGAGAEGAGAEGAEGAEGDAAGGRIVLRFESP